MSAATLELTPTVETPAQDADAITPAQLTGAIREAACRLDPAHCAVYQLMGLDRMLHATRAMTLLMRKHSAYRTNFRAGRGRRSHSAEMYRLLDELNPSDLVIAQAWATAACLFFDPDTAADKRVRRRRSRSRAISDGTPQR